MGRTDLNHQMFAWELVLVFKQDEGCSSRAREEDTAQECGVRPPLCWLLYHYLKTESCEARKALYCKNPQISPASLRHSSFTYSFFTVDRGACLVPARLWKHRRGTSTSTSRLSAQLAASRSLLSLNEWPDMAVFALVST